MLGKSLYKFLLPTEKECGARDVQNQGLNCKSSRYFSLSKELAGQWVNMLWFLLCRLCCILFPFISFVTLDLGVSQFLAILRAGSFSVGDKVVCAHQTITLTRKPNHISYLLTIKSHLNLVENQKSQSKPPLSMHFCQ